MLSRGGQGFFQVVGRCQLLAVNWWLLTGGCWLLQGSCQLPAIIVYGPSASGTTLLQKLSCNCMLFGIYIVTMVHTTRITDVRAFT